MENWDAQMGFNGAAYASIISEIAGLAVILYDTNEWYHQTIAFI